MSASPTPRVLQEFVEDELLRAPLLFDQLIEGTIDHARRKIVARQLLGTADLAAIAAFR